MLCTTQYWRSQYRVGATPPPPTTHTLQFEIDALGVNTTFRECFERCCSIMNFPTYHSNLRLATRRALRPTVFRASVYRTPSEASSRRRCGHASRVNPSPNPNSPLGLGLTWFLHDIAIANVVWCMAYIRRIGWGVVYCPIDVQ